MKQILLSDPIVKEWTSGAEVLTTATNEFGELYILKRLEQRDGQFYADVYSVIHFFRIGDVIAPNVMIDSAKVEECLIKLFELNIKFENE